MKIISEIKSEDGTRKFLIELEDGNKVESVLIKHKRTLCVCISSQVGCAMKCSFCATGLMGFKRNLSDAEIIGQLDLLQSVSDDKITNIVFMGMGEPLHNYDNVIKAVNEFRKREFSWKKITVSTVGFPDKIKQLSKDTQCMLAISLHAPNDELRKQLVPTALRFSIKDILEACKHHPTKTGLPLMIEYVLIDGINNSLQNAKELAKILKPFPHIMINLIPFNKVDGIDYQTPSEESNLAFKQTLIDAGYKSIIRTTKGIDQNAACGMLSTKNNLKQFI